MSKYTELKAKHQAEVDAFPFGFAFNQKQFDEMMKEFGLTPDDTDKIYKIGGGGYIRKTDSEAMNEMFERHEAEHKAAMQDDEYLYEMFYYELANHEYGYTQDLTDTLEALDLTIEEINTDPRMADALKRAIAAQGD
jgi:chaperonin cofactor prefoldin